MNLLLKFSPKQAKCYYGSLWDFKLVDITKRGIHPKNKLLSV